MLKRYDGPIIYQNPLAPTKQGKIAKTKLQNDTLQVQKTLIKINPTSKSIKDEGAALNTTRVMGMESS